MKKFLPLLLLLFCGMVKAQIVNFTDPQFKAYLLSASFTNNIAINSSFISSKIDTNNDGEIQESEAQDIVRLWIEDIQITDVQGLEAFTGLEEVTIKGTSMTSFGLDMAFLSKLQITQNPLLTTVFVGGMPSLYQLDCIFNPVLTSLNAANCDLLENASVNDNNLLTLDFSNHPVLLNLYCQNNNLSSINVANCPSLNGLSADNNQLTSVDVSGKVNLVGLSLGNNENLTSVNASGCVSLESGFLNLENNYDITALDFTNCSSLDNLVLPNLQLSSLNVSGCSSLIELNANNNHLTTLDLSGCSQLQILYCNQNTLSAIDLTPCTSLQYFSANDNVLSNINFNSSTTIGNFVCDNNQITNLDLSGMTALTFYNISENPLSVLDISGCTALTGASLPADSTMLTSVNAQGCTALVSIALPSPMLQSVNVQGCTALQSLTIVGNPESYAPITAVDVSNLPALTTLWCDNTNIAALDFTGSTALIHLSLNHNMLTEIDVLGLSELEALGLGSNPIQTIDVSGLHHLNNLYLYENPLLETIYAKNGSNEFGTLPAGSPLQFICQDEAFIDATQSLLNAAGLTTTVCNSYCTMTPGTNFNTISGIIHYDADNNGCDASDMVQPDMRIDINDGTQTGTTFTNAEGGYTYFTGAGNFDISLGIENPGIFSVTPASITIPFADDENHIETVDFCIAANGVQNDVEVVIAPITPAKPGFSALYQIVIKNKGNQIVNGSYSFAYDDTLMDFVVATTAISSQTTGMLNWNYTNLLPFENRSVYVLMNVNSPMQTPPVNQDDVLEFTATVNPIVNDINATDNQFIYQQTVVNSFDPNDITCMEGETISPQDIGKYLHYVINFENTGTYAAEQVVVKVVIDDTKYDINSLQLLNTSHSVRPVIRGNTAEFFFEGIDLAAAAGDPPVGGHGNILFKIRTLSTLVTGDEVITKADIFFDYNFPIETNQARSVFETLSAPGTIKDQSITLYPNPAKNFVTIECDNIIRTISIYDVQGRILEILKRDSNNVTLDISNRAKGIYFIKIMTDKGMQVQKIVKE